MSRTPPPTLERNADIVAEAARVTPLEGRQKARSAEERPAYRTAQRADEEASGFTQIPRFVRTRHKKLTAGEWAVLTEVLDRTISWNRFTPQDITITQFCAASGLSTQPVVDGIASLVRRGLLFEERKSGRKNSRCCYALIAPENPGGTGPYTIKDGERVILLLGA